MVIRLSSSTGRYISLTETQSEAQAVKALRAKRGQKVRVRVLSPRVRRRWNKYLNKLRRRRRVNVRYLITQL